MNNRVDYLSDKLVNLRGKLKNVNEVVPPESIASSIGSSFVVAICDISRLQSLPGTFFIPLTEYHREQIRYDHLTGPGAHCSQPDRKFPAVVRMQMNIG